MLNDAVAVGRRPTRASAGLAALAVAGGTVLVGGPGGSAVGVVLVGLAAMAAGDELRSRGRRIQSWLVLGVGVAIALGGVAAGAVMADDFPGTLQALPGLLGVLLLGAGLVPVRGQGSRRLVKLGAGLVLVGVMIAGIFRAVPAGTLVAGAAVALVGWDLGEHAINVGEQMGRTASTWRAEGVHAVGAGLVGVTAVLTADLVDGVGSTGLSLPALALLVLAVVLLSVALHE
jgi:hypothetical protein